MSRKKQKVSAAKCEAGNYRFTGMVKEDHRSQIYYICFCDQQQPPYDRLFATVGANRASIYECEPSGTITPRQVYADDDTDEIFYGCAWSIDEPSGAPLLAVAGLRGIVKIINCTTQKVIASLLGHGNSVNDIMFHPIDPALLVSASKDESIRLWNTITGACIAIFAGHQGHRDEVLSANVHPLGNAMASSGMDNTIKIWSLEDENLQSAIRKSYDRTSDMGSFPTQFVQFPIFSSAKVHSDYVDCVRWVGNLLLSKSTGNKLVLWKPNTARRKDAVTVLRELQFSDANIWFVRFSLDVECMSVAAGNKTGKVFVWDVDGVPQVPSSSMHEHAPQIVTHSRGARSRQNPQSPIKVAHPQCTTTVRQTAFSSDGRTLLYCCDDSTIWRWDKAK